MKSRKKWQSRTAIVLAGFALGYLARYISPPVEENLVPSREFTETLVREESISELPILPTDDFEFTIPNQLP